MSKKPAHKQASKAGGRVEIVKSGDGWIVRRDAVGRAIYYDSKSGRVGYGSKYGEGSYNARPVDAVLADAFGDSRSKKTPYGPFDAPKPKTGSGLNVVPHERGWAVRRQGAHRASRVFGTQHEAIDYGRTVARRDGTELRIQDAQGRWRDAESYARDPNPPRDATH